MKITVIGGAGVRTVIFINGLLQRYRKLNIDEVVLYDIDKEKQEIIGKLCKYVVARKNEELKVRVADDAVSAIKDADYIVTTLRVGGDHARTVDEALALKCGVIGQETTGIGGFSMAVRTIPALLDYSRLIKEYAGDAWIFNFTNPSGLVTQALNSAGYEKIIGICDAPSSTKYRMAEKLGVSENRLYVEFFGLNHLSWIKSVKLDGKEILNDLLCDNEFLSSIQEFSIFDSELLRSIGYLPNEYLYYYYHREKVLENMLKATEARGKAIEEVNIKMMQELKKIDIDNNPEEALQIFLYYMQVRENSYMRVEAGTEKATNIEKGKLEVPDGIGYAGVMLDCIEGMQSIEGRNMVLSVKNNGSIPFLRDEDVVEMTCNVSQNGIVPVKVQDVPEHCELLIRLIKRYERMTVEYINTKDREKALGALMMHPLINSYSLGEKLLDCYDEAYGGLLK